MSQLETSARGEAGDSLFLSQVARYRLIIMAAVALLLMGMSADDAVASGSGAEAPEPESGSSAPKDNLRDGPPIFPICDPDKHAWVERAVEFSGMNTFQCARCGLVTRMFAT